MGNKIKPERTEGKKMGKKNKWMLENSRFEIEEDMKKENKKMKRLNEENRGRRKRK